MVVYLRADEAGGGALLPGLRGVQAGPAAVRHAPARRAGLAAQVLSGLGVRAVRLVEDDLADARELATQGIRVVPSVGIAAAEAVL